MINHMQYSSQRDVFPMKILKYWCIHLLDEECSNGEANENPQINKLVIDSSKK